MNYLAHLYLSGNDEKIMVGNFIGDYVKGRNFENFPEKIGEGIRLHRRIDSFTDAHPLVLEAKIIMRPEFRLYSGIIVDFFYDHFLAQKWNSYSDISLRDFAKRAHAILLSNYRHLPLRVQGFLPFLIQNRRLESYASVDGILQSIEIMGKYSSLPSKPDITRKILTENYPVLKSNFDAFMPELIDFVNTGFNIKISKPAS